MVKNMRLTADIKKDLGSFSLDLCLESDAKRIGILGASGSGKSLTLRAIAGIGDPDRGHIEVDGRVLYDRDSRVSLKPQQRRVGYMFQSYALFPTMTVLENVMAGLKGPKKERREKAGQMLARMQLEGLADHMPSQLSGGQRQRTALARIMVTQPDLILLDEPFSALDGHLRDRMQVELLQMLEDYPGQTIMVSHSRDEIYRFSQEVFIISGGRILRSGRTRDVFADPQKKEAAILTGCKNYFPVQSLDAHTLHLTGWDLCLRLTRPIPGQIRWLGYRAHYFIPVWGEKKENCIPFQPERVDELPFEHNYYLRPPRETGSDHVPEARSKDPGASVPEVLRHEGREPEISDHGASVPEVPGHEVKNQDDTSREVWEPSRICWIVQGETWRMIRQKGLPDYLQLTEDAMMLLE